MIIIIPQWQAEELNGASIHGGRIPSMGESGCRRNDFLCNFSHAGFDVGRWGFFFVCGGEDVNVVFDGDEDGFLFGREGCRLICGFFLLLIVDGVAPPPLLMVCMYVCAYSA